MVKRIDMRKLVAVAAAVALAMCMAVGVPQEAQAKVYPTKKAAKKAVVAKVRKKWKKIKPRIKVEKITSKTRIPEDAKKEFEKKKRKAGKKAKKYNYYVVTLKSPKPFTVKARYRAKSGKVKTYSLKTACYAFDYGYDVYKDGNPVFPAPSALASFGKYDHIGRTISRSNIYAIKKGERAKAYCQFYEEHVKLTGKKIKYDGDDPFSDRYHYKVLCTKRRTVEFTA